MVHPSIDGGRGARSTKLSTHTRTGQCRHPAEDGQGALGQRGLLSAGPAGGAVVVQGGAARAEAGRAQHRPNPAILQNVQDEAAALVLVDSGVGESGQI